MKSAPKNIFEIAQQIAGTVPQNGNPGDINNMIKHVTESVMKMVDSGDIDINQMTSGLLAGNNFNLPTQPPQQIAGSKVDLTGTSHVKTYKEPKNKHTEYEELENDDSADELCPRTRDINISMNVSLVELYTGTIKKIAIRRKRLKNINGKMVPIEEKKKFVVDIKPGMRDEQIIRFNKESDEQQGYETGDVVITINENANDNFERDGDNLFIIKQIGLYEAYTSITKNTPIIIKHIDETYIECIPTETVLHQNNGIRKIVGKGMPIYNKKNPDIQEYGDLYIRFNLTLPEHIDPKHYNHLSILFPPINDQDTLDIYKYKDNKYTRKQDSEPTEKCQMEELTEEDLKEINNSEESEYEESEYEQSDSEQSEPESKKKYKKSK